MLPLLAFALAGERYLMMGASFIGVILVVCVFRRLGSRPAVIIGIAALSAVELLHRLRPSFHHPQNRTDVWIMLLAELLSLPLLFGLAWPICKVMDGLCDSQRRSSYVRSAMLSDFIWFAIALLAIGLSWRLGWWLS
jgi:hypothetical protein